MNEKLIDNSCYDIKSIYKVYNIWAQRAVT
jgi:hypothetical protein